VRFGRKAGTGPDETVDTSVDETAPAAATGGPLDADDLDLEDDPRFAEHIDLGGLLVAPPPAGVEVQLQVDEESQTVLAVLLTGDNAAMELRVFAASRGGDFWAEVRPQLASETARHGGTASEQDGPFGTELVCRVPVQTPDGKSGMQASRVIGVNGPRWFLRATVMGLPAVEPEASGPWEDALRSLVVRRGAGAMPPGEALELTLPPGTERHG
jgi:hypothetical protein